MQMVTCCIAAVRGELAVARDTREASVFFVASMVVRGNYPDAGDRLAGAAARYFEGRALPYPSTQEVVDAGWIVDVPRLRDMLEAAFRMHGVTSDSQEVPERRRDARLDLSKLFVLLEERFARPQPLQIYIVGRMACHLRTGRNLVPNVEITVSPGRVAIPQHVFVDIRHEDGSPQMLYLDPHVNEAHSLLHPAYRLAATRMDFGTSWLQIYVLDPVDIIINRAVLFSHRDRQDVEALMSLGTTSVVRLRTRVQELVASYVAIDAAQLVRLAELVHLAEHCASGGFRPRDC
jgi:hypothetical protein